MKINIFFKRFGRSMERQRQWHIPCLAIASDMLIFIGSHGMSNLREIFLGSVSEKVIRRCNTPVFVIKR